MTVEDGTDTFASTKPISSARLNKTVLWRGIALPVGAENEIPQNGILRLVDSMSAPTTSQDYIQTSAVLSSPNFVKIPMFVPIPEHSMVMPHTVTLADYSLPDNSGLSSVGGSTDLDAVVDAITAGGTDGTSMYFTSSGQRGAGFIVDAGNPLIGKIITQAECEVRKVGSPSGDLVCNHVRSGSVLQEIGRITATSLSASQSYHAFNTNDSQIIQEGDRISFDTTGGDSSNYVRLVHTGSVQTNFSASKLDNTGTYVAGTSSTRIGMRFTAAGGALSDDSTATKLITTSENNPYVTVSLAAPANLFAIAIYHDGIGTTETEIEIQVGDDLTTFVNVRTITESDLTNADWNYIRFNGIVGQYIRIIGTSMSTILSIFEVKVLTYTDSETALPHGHLDIDETDTGLGLDGK